MLQNLFVFDKFEQQRLDSQSGMILSWADLDQFIPPTIVGGVNGIFLQSIPVL